MTERVRDIYRVGYGLVFGVLLPALLAAWAVGLDRILTLPPYGSPQAGLALSLAGAGHDPQRHRRLPAVR